ncbi:hypothetical protein GCM10010393_15800 [Streptomyces gobitricini]|uniref:Uncharacterized protein n=1 Tax=Streptomyces gobitricini TaxID=68211 RepID=A0ABN3LKC3_9ACTN
MSHAYGPADEVPVWLRAMTSPGSLVREKALGDFYSTAHRQGDVYPCTAASLPFVRHGRRGFPDRPEPVSSLQTM